jgi:hypothetical protein
MAEEDIRSLETAELEEHIRLSEIRVKLCKEKKADVAKIMKAADEELSAELENMELLKFELERRRWAEAFEAGKKGLGDETG